MLIHYTLKSLSMRVEGCGKAFIVIHLDFRLELLPGANRMSLSLLVERFRLSRLLLCLRLDLSRSLARLRRTGDTDRLLERPILENLTLEKGERKLLLEFRELEAELHKELVQYTTTHI